MAMKRGELRVLKGTTIHGPMTRDQLAGLVAAGRVTGSDLVSVAEGPWGPVANYLGEGERPGPGVPEAEVDTKPARPAPSGWYYCRGGVQLGPVPSDRLKALAGSGDLDPADLVWKEGMPDWRPANTLKDLFPESVARTAGPPPLPTSAAPSSSVSPTPTTTAESQPTQPPPQSDFFDRARSFSRKASAALTEAKAKAEAYQDEIRAKSTDSQAILLGSAMAAADFARSDQAKELACKAREHLSSGTKAMAENPFVVGMALLGFFPLGLYLVWHHPYWTKTRKWAWTWAWLGCFCLLMLPALVAGGRSGRRSGGELSAVQEDSSTERSSGDSLIGSGKTLRSRRHWSAPPLIDTKFHRLNDVQTLPPYVQQARGEGKGAWRFDRLSWGYPDKADADCIVYLVEEKTGYTAIIVRRSLANVDGEMHENALGWTWFPNDPSFPWSVVADDMDKLELEVGLEVKGLRDKVMNGYRTNIVLDKRNSSWSADSRHIRSGKPAETRKGTGKATYLPGDLTHEDGGSTKGAGIIADELHTPIVGDYSDQLRLAQVAIDEARVRAKVLLPKFFELFDEDRSLRAFIEAMAAEKRSSRKRIEPASRAVETEGVGLHEKISLARKATRDLDNGLTKEVWTIKSDLGFNKFRGFDANFDRISREKGIVVPTREALVERLKEAEARKDAFAVILKDLPERPIWEVHGIFDHVRSSNLQDHLDDAIDRTYDGDLGDTLKKHAEGVSQLHALHARFKSLPPVEGIDQVILAYEELLADLEPEGGPDRALARWNRIKELYRELKDAAKEIEASVRATIPRPSNAGLHYVSGFSHLIKGDLYYIENKIVRIPKKYLGLFSTGSAGPNVNGIMGSFRFTGNDTGKNAFGAVINVETYEADRDYSEAQLAGLAIEKRFADFFRAVGGGDQQSADVRKVLSVYESLVGKEAVAEISKNAPPR